MPLLLLRYSGIALHSHYDTQLFTDFSIVDNTIARGHAYKVRKCHCNSDAAKYFFSNRMISIIWNNLPDFLVRSPTAVTFRCRLFMMDFSYRVLLNC